MNIFRRFAHRWAMYKTYGEFKDHAATTAIGQLIAEQLDHNQAPNYVEMTFGSNDGRKFVLNVRRFEGETPHQLRKAAEAEAFDLLQSQARLVKALRELHEACEANTGNEPSLSVYHRQLDRTKALLLKFKGAEL